MRGVKARRVIKMARAHAIGFGGGDLFFGEAERHQQIAAFAGGHIGRQLKHGGAHILADHQRVHGGAEIERVGGGFLDGFERWLCEAEFFQPFEIDARRAAQCAMALGMARDGGDCGLVIPERGECGARFGAEHAAKSAISAHAKAGDGA